MVTKFSVNDIKEESIDIFRKVIVFDNKEYGLNEVVSHLYETDMDTLEHLKKTLIFKLRLYGFNGFDIYNYLDSVGFRFDE